MNKYIFVLCLSILGQIGVMGEDKQISAEKKLMNKHPIVLVHGFAGWGPGELLGYNYWGGLALDIEKDLRKKKFSVFTASVGPISCNHDRACQLFYQIKGGQVDYGLPHTKEHPHEQLGKSFLGFHPEWSEENPVHLIGHSMGGQTIRLLSELLEQDYFKLGTNSRWLKSITTISAPHNGTTLATMIDNFSGGYTERIIAALLAIAGTNWEVYDFDLGFWGFTPKKGESLSDFLGRVDDLMETNRKDFALYDLKPEGARELNEKIRHFEDIFYFSYGTEETYTSFFQPKYEVPELGMNPFLWGFSHYMGSYQGSSVSAHKDWWKNDGVINTISMKAPHNAKAVDYNGTPQKAVWNYMGTIKSKDHLKVVGHYQGPFSGAWLEGFYADLAQMLSQLPE